MLLANGAASKIGAMAIKKRPAPNGSAPHATNAANGRWLARLGMYHHKRALKFETEQDLHKAIDAIWEPTDELYRMPHAPGDALTMIVPNDAVPLFRNRRFRFIEYPVAPATRGTNRPSGSNVA